MYHFKKITVVCFLFSLFMFFTEFAFSQNTQDTSENHEFGYHTHDGFFFRFLGGFGSQSTNYEEFAYSNDLKMSGSGVNVNFLFGGALSPNIVIFYEMGIYSLEYPELELGEETAQSRDMTTDTITQGFGFSYYILPSNIYFGISVNRTKASITTDVSGEETTGSSDWGYGFSISCGKEWWASDNWGLGVAGIFSYSSMKDQGLPNNISNLYYGIAFTATYN